MESSSTLIFYASIRDHLIQLIEGDDPTRVLIHFPASTSLFDLILVDEVSGKRHNETIGQFRPMVVRKAEY
ncbi:MAG: hypothetical protein ABIU09_10360 [Pyrinomonadaceae bacterium]